MHFNEVPYQTKDYFSIRQDHEFEKLALNAFRYQYQNNTVYRDFCGYLLKSPENVVCVEEIPFLPIELFKNQIVISGSIDSEAIFKSSGTTGPNQSKHFVKDLAIYRSTAIEGFKRVFGSPSDFSFIALLPGYMDRPDSSLIYMVNEFMGQSKAKNNGFFKDPSADFFKAVEFNLHNHIPSILFGVTFSLLKLAESSPIQLNEFHIIETGGMKGYGEELTRDELHIILKDSFKTNHIYSEYGMTELLSQAYTKGAEDFELPAWMKVYIREVNDPQAFLPEQKVGAINIIDLANIHSCCFIATQDLGKKTSPNTFQVLGRFDNVDIRGCNLLYL